MMISADFEKFPDGLKTRIECVRGSVHFALESSASRAGILKDIEKLLAPVHHESLPMRWETAGIVGNAVLAALTRAKQESDGKPSLSTRFQMAFDGSALMRQTLISGYEKIAAHYAGVPQMSETIAKLRERYDPMICEKRAEEKAAVLSRADAPATCGPAPAGR